MMRLSFSSLLLSTTVALLFLTNNARAQNGTVAPTPAPVNGTAPTFPPVIGGAFTNTTDAPTPTPSNGTTSTPQPTTASNGTASPSTMGPTNANVTNAPTTTTTGNATSTPSPAPTNTSTTLAPAANNTASPTTTLAPSNNTLLPTTIAPSTNQTYSPSTTPVPTNATVVATTTLAPTNQSTLAPTQGGSSDNATASPSTTASPTTNRTSGNFTQGATTTVWDILEQDPETEWFRLLLIEDGLDVQLQELQTDWTIFVLPQGGGGRRIMIEAEEDEADAGMDAVWAHLFTPPEVRNAATDANAWSKSVLQNHLVQGQVLDIAMLQTMDGQSIRTLNGKEWVVDVLVDNVFLTSGATVVEVLVEESNLLATNGVVHYVDALLIHASDSEPFFSQPPANQTTPTMANNNTTTQTSPPTQDSSSPPGNNTQTPTTDQGNATAPEQTPGATSPPAGANRTTPRLVQINTSFQMFNTKGLAADYLLSSPEEKRNLDLAFAKFVTDVVNDMQESQAARHLRALVSRRLATTLNGTRIVDIQDADCQDADNTIPDNATCVTVDGQYDLLVEDAEADEESIYNTYMQATNDAIAEGKLQESLEEQNPSSSFAVAGPVVDETDPIPPEQVETPAPTTVPPTEAPKSDDESSGIEWWMILLLALTGANTLGCLFFGCAFYNLWSQVNSNLTAVAKDISERKHDDDDEGSVLLTVDKDKETPYSGDGTERSSSSRRASAKRYPSYRSPDQVVPPTTPTPFEEEDDFDSLGEDESDIEAPKSIKKHVSSESVAEVFEDEPGAEYPTTPISRVASCQEESFADEEDEGTGETDDADRDGSGSEDSDEEWDDEDPKGEGAPLVSPVKDSDEEIENKAPDESEHSDALNGEDEKGPTTEDEEQEQKAGNDEAGGSETSDDTPLKDNSGGAEYDEQDIESESSTGWDEPGSGDEDSHGDESVEEEHFEDEEQPKEPKSAASSYHGSSGQSAETSFYGSSGQSGDTSYHGSSENEGSTIGTHEHEGSIGTHEQPSTETSFYGSSGHELSSNPSFDTLPTVDHLEGQPEMQVGEQGDEHSIEESSFDGSVDDWEDEIQNQKQ